MKRSAQLESFGFFGPSPAVGGGKLIAGMCVALLLSMSAKPAEAATSAVFSNGVMQWGGDWSWGVSVNYQDYAGSALSGKSDIAVSGIGGYQPFATNYAFDPSPYNYLIVSLKPTIPNQRWDSTVYGEGNVAAGKTVNVLQYGPAPIVGQWNTYRIPLGAGGYQLPAGTKISKFMFIDQTADVQGSGYSTNRWYVDNLYFSSDSTSAVTSTSGTSTAQAASGATAVKSQDVYSYGTYKWGDDWSWSVAVNYKDTSGLPLTGPYDISVKGIGGYQPHAPNSDFDPSPYKYLTVALKPTVPNQKWDSAIYATDGSVVGVNVLNYGPAPVVGKWNIYKIPLGAGGYGLASGKHILKFMFIDQTADAPNSGYGTNTWYVDNLSFTTDGTSVSTGGGTTPPPPTGGGTTPPPPPPTGGGTTSPPPSGVTWMYLNGAKTLAGDFTGQGNTTDYQHATGSGYNGGTRDILISDPGPWGYFIPYWAANYRLPNPGYTYLIMSIKPTRTGDTFNIHAERVGDQGLPSIDVMKYGPAAVAGKWGTYTIPLKDLGVYGDATLYKVVLQTNTNAGDSWEMDAIGFK